MNRKWIITIVVIVVAYFAWRKYGDQVKSAISSATA